MYGPGTLKETSTRRSIYFTVKRSQLIPMLQVFDWPDALQGMGELDRPPTIAPQALLLDERFAGAPWAVGPGRRAAEPAATIGPPSCRQPIDGRWVAIPKPKNRPMLWLS